MASRPDLRALASRCESEEPSEELWLAISRAMGWKNLNENDCMGPGIVRWRTPDRQTTCHGFGPPDWLCSLDAAVSIFPKCPRKIDTDPRKVVAAALRARARLRDKKILEG